MNRMSLLYCIALLLLGFPGATAAVAQTRPVTPMSVPTTITASGKFPSGEHLLPNRAEDGSGAAVEIVGDNLTVDFQGAILRGTPAATNPDKRLGTGVRVRGRNITLKNLKVHGYKIGLYARDCPGLRLENSDFSWNWKQHLKSTQEREDLSDWMSFHQNEKDEWLRYGAAIYLRNCDDFTVSRCRAIGGQCGLMLSDCNRGTAFNNDFSYLSAIGVGMYRSCGNRILHNRIDWCVRGYSHGVYNRGQDSAGILIYEQSNRNTFAYNSVTHGGDGFFLWAGQTTMDTGKGGCNDNVLYGNDFSHAPTNGIEATFSRNIFAGNLVLECWHGVWGGFSFNSLIVGNIFGLNAEAIAIEHGQENVIEGNVFQRDNVAVRLWQNASVDPDWGYGKTRDVRSRDYRLSGNLFRNECVQCLNVRDTTGVKVDDTNAFVTNAKVATLTGKTDGFLLPTAVDPSVTGTPLPPTMQSSGNAIMDPEPTTRDYLARFDVGWKPMDDPRRLHTAGRPLTEEESRRLSVAPFYVEPLKDGQDPFLKPGALRGRRYIMVDEWGPYDFRRPLLWPRGLAGAPNVRRFEILGPTGKWRVVTLSPGVTLSSTTGTVPGEVTVTLPTTGKGMDIKIALEYIGEETTDYRGISTPAGKPISFGYEQFIAPIDWTVRFYTWEKDKSDPRTQEAAFKTRLAGTPLATVKTDRLDYAGYGQFVKGVPATYFATIAEGTLEIAPGDYTLEITSDDGCRVFLDGKQVIAGAWKYQGPTTYTATVKLGGKHTLRVEHFQIDGYATLKVGVRPKQP